MPADLVRAPGAGGRAAAGRPGAWPFFLLRNFLKQKNYCSSCSYFRINYCSSCSYSLVAVDLVAVDLVAVDLVLQLLPAVDLVLQLLPAVDLVLELLPAVDLVAGAGVCVCVHQVPGVCDPGPRFTNIRTARRGPRRVGRGPRGQVRGPRRAWPGA